MLPPCELSRGIRYGTRGLHTGSGLSSDLFPEGAGPILPPHLSLCCSPAPCQANLLSSIFPGLYQAPAFPTGLWP